MDNDDLNKIENKNDNTHSIYNYLKSNPGVLITILSFIAAIGGSSIKIIDYLLQMQICEYWGIDTVYAKKDGTGFIYDCVIALVCLLAYLVINDFIRSITDHIAFNVLVRHINNGDFLKHTLNYEHMDIKEMIIGLFALVIFGIAQIFFSAVNCIGIGLIGLYSLSSVLFILCLCFCLNMIFSLKVCLSCSHQLDNQVKELANNKDCMKNIKMYEYIFDSREKINPNDFLDLTNTKIVAFFFMALLSSLLFICGNMMQFKNFMDYRKQFDIVSVSDDKYVIVYYTGQEYIMERATLLSNGTLLINTKEKHSIKSGEISYSSQTFNTVIKK